jgi:hypothetical protein
VGAVLRAAQPKKNIHIISWVYPIKKHGHFSTQTAKSRFARVIFGLWGCFFAPEIVE